MLPSLRATRRASGRLRLKPYCFWRRPSSFFCARANIIRQSPSIIVLHFNTALEDDQRLRQILATSPNGVKMDVIAR